MKQLKTSLLYLQFQLKFFSHVSIKCHIITFLLSHYYRCITDL